MDIREFTVKGEFRMGEDWKPYTKVVTAQNETQAKERIFTLMGSKHRLKRQYVRITEVSPV
jgi:large subunit ribosomal protein LX